ncbi:MAG TPA: hypothetical protein VHO24_11015 [Opitutaceae bacterium]|nr:hypothetical protein [Opitutaceae bacterium]
MSAFSPSSGHTRVRRVRNFTELVATPFADGVNALCWERTLPGNFGEVIGRLGAGEGIVPLDETRLRALDLSAAGKAAVEFMLGDLTRLQAEGRDPVLNCIHEYPRDEEAGPVATDVFSFHADSAPVEADTWLCTYFGAPSEGVRNEEARRRVEVPETRAELLRLFGGEAGDAFEEFLRGNCYDLHYAPLPSARPYSFGVGNLWRIAVDWPGSPVPPCIHRAPSTVPGQPPRLLLIS